MTDQALQDYYHFDEGDLADNRNGRLSEKQQKTLLADQKSGRRWGFFGGLGCGVVFMGIAAIFPLAFGPVAIGALQRHDTGSAIGASIAVIVWAVVWGGIGLFGLASGLSTVFDKPAAITLKSVTGPVNLVGVERTSGGRHSHHYIQHELHAGDQEFHVDESLAGHVMQGDIYAIYFTDDDQILSLERIGKG